MSKRKSLDKAQVRERRNKLLESAAAAELSLTEGVREMRAIAGMTQEEFAKHRGVSARVIKAIELEQGNPTVATLNRIGEFFGLEVGFVRAKRKPEASEHEHASNMSPGSSAPSGPDAWRTDKYEELKSSEEWKFIQDLLDTRNKVVHSLQTLSESLTAMDTQLETVVQIRKNLEGQQQWFLEHDAQAQSAGDSTEAAPKIRKNKKRSGS